MPYWDNGHMDSGWGVVVVLLMLVIVVLAGAAVAWFVRATGGPATPITADREAEKILAERLARGDIEAEEYRARLEVLALRR